MERLRNAIETVLSQNHYRYNALRMKEAIDRSGSAHLAADIVEKAIVSQNVMTSLVA
jgi:UDP:flavonoid glycosyltransferase YjiC (YdhE family)